MGVVIGNNTTAAGVPAVDDLFAILRAASRRNRQAVSFSDSYTIGLAGVLAVAVLTSLVASNPWVPSGCIDPWCSVGVESRSVASVLGFSLLVYLSGMLVGPISVSAAEAFWIFSSPIARARLMQRRKIGLLLHTAIAGVIVGFAHFWLWSANLWWFVAFPLTAVTVSTLTMMHEGRRPPIRVATTTYLAVGAVVAGIASVFPVLISATISSTVVPVALGLAAAITLLITRHRAWSNPNTLPLALLRRVRGARDAVAGAVSAADSGLLLDVIWARLLGNRSFVTGFRLKATGWRAVLEGETRRCLRSPLLLTRTLLLISMAAFASLFGVSVLLIGLSLTVMVFASLNMSTLRLYATSRGLARSLPQPAILVRLLLSLPTLILLLGVVLALSVVAVFVPEELLPLPSGLAILSVAIAGLAGAIRWTTVAPTQFSAGMLMTEMGPIPVSAMANATRGLDAAVLLALPAVLGFDPVMSLAISIACLLRFLLRG